MVRVGIFDSGVGGLTVWREIVDRAPHVETLYVADQQHLPYGACSRQQVLAFSRGITRMLIANDCRVVVLACNTASAVALNVLREEFPAVRFVGMEPAIKPAAARSRNGVVAVLATPTTLQGALFENTSAQLETPVRIVRQPCPGLVECIESGHNDDATLEPLLSEFLRAPRAADADTLVLACTHYPFVRNVIQRLVGPNVHIVDPAEAVARQVQRVAQDLASGAPQQHGRGALQPTHTFFTTGDPPNFARVAQRWLCAATIRAGAARWDGAGTGEMILRADGRLDARDSGSVSQQEKGRGFENGSA